MFGCQIIHNFAGSLFVFEYAKPSFTLLFALPLTNSLAQTTIISMNQPSGTTSLLKAKPEAEMRIRIRRYEIRKRTR